MIVVVCLLLAWRLAASFYPSSEQQTCPAQSSPYAVKSGDTCWDIAEKNGHDAGKLGMSLLQFTERPIDPAIRQRGS